MSGAPYEAERERKQHNPLLLALVFAAFAFVVAFFLKFHFFVVLGAQFIVLAAWAAENILVTKPRAIVRRVKVRAKKGELWLDDERFDVHALSSASVLHFGGEDIVRLERHFAPAIEIVVPNVRDGRALLHALGYDASQALARFRLASRLRVYPEILLTAALSGVPVLALLGVVTHSIALPIGLVALVLALVLWPTRVDVGPDGVRLAWLGWRTFLRASEIEAVEDLRGVQSAIGALLDMKGGRAVKIPFGQSPVALRAGAAFAERVREVMGTEPAENAPSVLARNDLRARDWIAALRSLVHAESYRSTSVDEEMLWRVVEAAGAPASDRAAAAVALARDDTSRERLRVAASVIVEPKLRVAIEAATADDEEALERALDDLREL